MQDEAYGVEGSGIFNATAKGGETSRARGGVGRWLWARLFGGGTRSLPGLKGNQEENYYVRGSLKKEKHAISKLPCWEVSKKGTPHRASRPLDCLRGTSRERRPPNLRS